MKKLIIYTDTSVIGGCLDKEFSYYSNLLIDDFLSNKCLCMISDVTLKEMELAPESVIKIFKSIPEKAINKCFLDEETEFLAKAYIDEKAVSPKFLLDAQHIALATCKGADVLVSWNFKHIVNINRIRQYNSVNIKYGYRILEIRTPMEVVSEK